MDRTGSYLRCPNCGTTFQPDDSLPSESRSRRAMAYRCPVCQYEVAATRERLVSVEALGADVSSLVERARVSGVAPDEIVRILRDELAFMAEMANQGRRLHVEIIDLGPHDNEVPALLNEDGRELLTHRGRSAAAMQ